MPGPAPTTLNPLPTTAAWNAGRYAVSYIGRVNSPSVDPATNLPISHILYSAFGDLTGDGWPEIVISGWSYRQGFGSTSGAPPAVPITVISTSASGAVQLSPTSLLGVSTSAGTSVIRIADFNRDGRNDLFIGGHNESPFVPVASTLFTASANGFTSRASTFLTTGHEGFHGDFNGDGILDVVLSAYHTTGPLPTIWTTGNSHGTTWFQGNPDRPALLLNIGDGQGGFRTYPIAFDHPNADLSRADAYTFANWGGGSASAFADFDNDGRSEIVVTDLFTRANFRNGNTYLISNIQFEENSAYGTITALPLPYFDRDTTYSGAISAFGDKSHDVQIMVFDYNNDGLLDILINTMLWNPGNEDGGQDYSVTQVLRNDGGLRFTDVTDSVFFNAYLGKQDPGHDTILVDVNGDGFLDLVSTAEPDYVNGQVRPNSHSNEVFINTGDGKFVSVMWTQFEGLTTAVNNALIGMGVNRGSFPGTGHTFFPYVRPDGGLSFVTFETVHLQNGTFDRHYFNVAPSEAFSTGPGGANPALQGAAGFNEAYYLTSNPSVAAAVQSGQYANGLAHYLAVGRAAGLQGFAANAQVQGSAGADIIVLREGNEKAFGLAGDDIFTGGLGNDYLDGGSGFDIADYTTASSGITVDLRLSGAQNTGGAGSDTLVSIEGVRGSASADTLTGDNNANLLSGGGGNDVLRGNGGNDILDGGAGFDVAIYGGLRRQYVASSTGVSGGGEGSDTLTGIEEARFVDGVLSFDENSAYAQVLRLFDAVLDRLPDQAGMEFQANALLTGGLSLLQLTENFINSAEFQARFGGLSNAAFIDNLFRFSLGRPGDAAGIQAWVDVLNSGVSRAQVVMSFSESPEHRAQLASVVNAGLWIPDAQALMIARLYDAAFERLPDAAGLSAWLGLLKAGAPLLQIAASFAGSPEFVLTYGSLTNQQFVEQIYRACLDREGDPAGVQAWTNLLNQGASRSQVLVSFSESPEHVALTAHLWSGGIRYPGYVGGPVEIAPKGQEDALVLPGHLDDLVYDPADLGLTLTTKDDDGFVLPADPDGGLAPWSPAVDDALHVLASAAVTPMAPGDLLIVLPDESVAGLHRDHLDLAWA